MYKSFTLEEGDQAKFDVILAKFDGNLARNGTQFTNEPGFTKGIKSKESLLNRLYEAFMNWRNTAILVQFVISKYETGLSSEFPIKLCRRNCS